MPTPDFSKIWASNSPLPEFTFSDSEYLTGWDFVGSAPPTKNEFDAWFKLVDEKLNWLYSQLQTTVTKLYPVGSVYISFNSTDPSTLFGGTWQRLKDTFLLANGDAYAPNTSGGNATKTITTDNLPAHTHSRGTMNITGSILNTDSDEPWGSADAFSSEGALSVSVRQYRYGGVFSAESGGGVRSITLDASNGWTGETSSVGNGLPLNIMPPYKTVYMWRRTA